MAEKVLVTGVSAVNGIATPVWFNDSIRIRVRFRVRVRFCSS
jgi:hypothetical protein